MYNSRLTITEDGITKDYITIKEHKRLTEVIINFFDIDQLIDLIDKRLRQPYSQSNPYFINMKRNRFNLIELRDSVKLK